MTTEMTKIILCALMFLAGCKGDEHCHNVSHYDQRQKVFSECMKAQIQPTQNHENDNGHYVEACDSASYHVANETICEVEQ